MRGSKAPECVLHRIGRCMHLRAGACATSSTFCIHFQQVGVCLLASQFAKFGVIRTPTSQPHLVVLSAYVNASPKVQLIPLLIQKLVELGDFQHGPLLSLRFVLCSQHRQV